MYLLVFVFSFRALSSIFDFSNLVWASCPWEPSTALRDGRHENGNLWLESAVDDETAARSTGRLIPVTVGDLAASNTATAPSRVKVSPRIARQAADEARWADGYGAFRATWQVMWSAEPTCLSARGPATIALTAKSSEII